MTDLDRQVAEAKGWRPDPENAILWRGPDGHGCGIVEADIAFRWSTDLSRAWELVAELEERERWLELRRADDGQGGPRWVAVFKFVSSKMVAIKPARGHGATPAEAICRAYLGVRRG